MIKQVLIYVGLFLVSACQLLDNEVIDLQVPTDSPVQGAWFLDEVGGAWVLSCSDSPICGGIYWQGKAKLGFDYNVSPPWGLANSEAQIYDGNSYDFFLWRGNPPKLERFYAPKTLGESILLSFEHWPKKPFKNWEILTDYPYSLNQELDTQLNQRFYEALDKGRALEPSGSLRSPFFYLKRQDDWLIIEDKVAGNYLLNLSMGLVSLTGLASEYYAPLFWPIDSSQGLFQGKYRRDFLYCNKVSPYEEGYLALVASPSESLAKGLRYYSKTDFPLPTQAQCRYFHFNDSPESYALLNCKHDASNSWIALSLVNYWPFEQANELGFNYIIFQNQNQPRQHKLYRLERDSLFLEYAFESEAKSWISSRALVSGRIAFSSPETSECIVWRVKEGPPHYHLRVK